MGKFNNQVAAISGSADGIGKAVANLLALEGAILALFDINKQLLYKTVEEFLDKGFKAIGFKTDIADENSVEQAFDQPIKFFGKVDIMVINLPQTLGFVKFISIISIYNCYLICIKVCRIR